MRLRSSICLLAGLSLFWGCSGSTNSPQAARPVAAPKAKPAPKKEAEVPSLFDRTGDDYSYNPVGKRDPFMQYGEEAVIEDVSLPKSPLERFSLDQLKITAIVWGISDPRALVQAPDAQSYIVRKNMRIGTNRGRVSKITRSSVYVEQEYRDPTGKLVVSEQVLDIRADEKDKDKKGEDQQLLIKSAEDKE